MKEYFYKNGEAMCEDEIRDKNCYKFLLGLMLKGGETTDCCDVKEVILKDVNDEKDSFKNKEGGYQKLLKICFESAYKTATRNIKDHGLNLKNMENIIKNLDNNVIYSEYYTTKNKEEMNGKSFGVKQKWINMSLKYLYVLSKKYKWLKDRVNFDNCHCPVDRQILRKIKSYIENTQNEKIKEYQKHFAIENYFVRDDDGSKKVAWSDLGENDYVIVQNCISAICNEEKICPLQFDFDNWG